MNKILLIGSGGAIGSILRYLIYLLCSRWQWQFPMATLLVNIIGSFFIAICYVWIAESMDPYSQHLKALLMVGVLGGFTTFSSFSLESIMLIMQQRYWLAIIYIAASLIICLSVTAATLTFFRN